MFVKLARNILLQRPTWKISMLDRDYLLRILDNDPLTGKFRWKLGRKGVAAGTSAGTIDKDGYLVIMIDGKNYFAHRLAWFMNTGAWPVNDLDHKNLSNA